jgi:hypothetical protein
MFVTLQLPNTTQDIHRNCPRHIAGTVGVHEAAAGTGGTPSVRFGSDSTLVAESLLSEPLISPVAYKSPSGSLHRPNITGAPWQVALPHLITPLPTSYRSTEANIFSSSSLPTTKGDLPRIRIPDAVEANCASATSQSTDVSSADASCSTADTPSRRYRST